MTHLSPPTFADLVPTHESSGSHLDLALAGWLDAKQGRSGSAKTRRAYADAITGYRAALERVGLDLDCAETQGQAMALVAQSWAGQCMGQPDRPVSPATYNQRLSILSSFFAYAAARGLIPVTNPIATFAFDTRRRVEAYGGAQPLNAAEVKARLDAIDRETLAGKRDYALLVLALTTGRRLSEVTHLRWGHVRARGSTVTVAFHGKGGKVLHDTLAQPVAHEMCNERSPRRHSSHHRHQFLWHP